MESAATGERRVNRTGKETIRRLIWVITGSRWSWHNGELVGAVKRGAVTSKSTVSLRFAAIHGSIPPRGRPDGPLGATWRVRNRCESRALPERMPPNHTELIPFLDRMQTLDVRGSGLADWRDWM
jgi:hypothetical protein